MVTVVSQDEWAHVIMSPRTATIRVLQARELISTDLNGLADPYCKILVHGSDSGSMKVQYKSTVRFETLNPVWAESFEVPLDSHDPYIIVEVWDRDQFNQDDFMGRIFLPVRLLTEDPILQWYPLCRAAPKDQVKGEIQLEVSINPSIDETEQGYLNFELQTLCRYKKLNINVVCSDICGGGSAAGAIPNTSEMSVKTFSAETSASDAPSPSPTAASASSATTAAITATSLSSSSQPAALALGGAPSPAIFELPGPSESVELVIPNVLIDVGGFRCMGRVYLSNYRLVIISDSDFAAVAAVAGFAPSLKSSSLQASSSNLLSSVASSSPSPLEGARTEAGADAPPSGDPAAFFAPSVSTAALNTFLQQSSTRKSSHVSMAIPFGVIVDVAKGTEQVRRHQTVGSTDAFAVEAKSLSIRCSDFRFVRIIFHSSNSLRDYNSLKRRLRHHHANAVDHPVTFQFVKMYPCLIRGSSSQTPAHLQSAPIAKRLSAQQVLSAVLSSAIQQQQHLQPPQSSLLRAQDEDDEGSETAPPESSSSTLDTRTAQSSTGADSTESDSSASSRQSFSEDVKRVVPSGLDRNDSKYSLDLNDSVIFMGPLGSERVIPVSLHGRRSVELAVQLPLSSSGLPSSNSSTISSPTSLDHISSAFAMGVPIGGGRNPFGVIGGVHITGTPTSSYPTSPTGSFMSSAPELLMLEAQMVSATGTVALHLNTADSAVSEADAAAARQAATTSQEALPDTHQAKVDGRDSGGPTEKRSSQDQSVSGGLPLPPGVSSVKCTPKSYSRFDIAAEMKRQQVPVDKWKLSQINEDYKICSSYPDEFYVPAEIEDDILIESAAFRSRGRLPVLAWYNSKKGNCITRSAQPLVGPSNKFSTSDEKLIETIRTISYSNKPLVIFDARSMMAAGGNKLKGKGTEDTVGRYTHCKILFLDIGNIHAMRESHDALVQVCETTSDAGWLSLLESTQWLTHIRSILSAAATIARYVDEKGVSVLIHCSDGWDRTTQLSSLSQLLLDGYYRTLAGFPVLVMKEWIAFGHKFKDRLGHHDAAHERSPIFLQFLDCTWQVIQQFPSAFEFTSDYVRRIAEHFNSKWFGTFLYNCDKDIKLSQSDTSTVSIWAYLEACRAEVINPHYQPLNETIYPKCSLKSLRLWNDFYLRYDELAYQIKDVQDDDDVNDTNSGGAGNLTTSSSGASLSSSSSVVMWVPDHRAKACHDCQLRFTQLRRKHHCRACGQIFCSECVKQKLFLPQLGYAAEEKVCESCFQKFGPQIPSKQTVVKVPGVVEVKPVATGPSLLNDAAG